MHAHTIVTRVLSPCLISLHAKQAKALLRATSALVQGALASLSGIALCLNAHTRLKHRVKSVDRLLGNTSVEGARQHIYGALAHRWLKDVEHILVVVDWSDLSKDQHWQLLRASVAVEGRSVALYEEVHAQKYLGNPKVHRRFLHTIQSLLPASCKVVVMTDAGFHAPWFKAVSELGWCFIGRLRGRNRVLLKHDSFWRPARALYQRAITKALDLGAGKYVHSNPVDVRLVLAKRPAKQRRQLTAFGTRAASKKSEKNARREKEPWLLATSPALSHLAADGIVALYRQRMSIEQSFRDTKNLRVGMGLEVSRSRSAQRLNILLLIVHLAAFVQRLIGERAKASQLELQFSATLRKDRPEISVLTLARRILDGPPHYLKQLSPTLAIAPLKQQAINAYAIAL